MSTVHWDFDSPGDVLAALERPPASGAGNMSVTYTAEESWDLGLGWDGALDAYTGGWSEGAKRAYDLSERLRPRPKGNRVTLHRSVTGAFPNVGAYLSGAPNAMYQVSKKQAISRPYVHLYMHISYGANIDANTAFDRGCALVAVADALESAGCRVRITLIRSSLMYVGSKRLAMRFMVKDYGDRLDVDQLIFTAAHPAMFRRICFGLQERSDDRDVVDATTRSYGTPADLVPADDFESDGKAILVNFPRLERNSRGSTPETFLAEMVRALPLELQTDIEGGE